MKNFAPKKTPYELGESGAASVLPDLIWYTRSLNANDRRLAASAIGKLAGAGVDCSIAVRPLCDLLTDPKPQVRQYALKALLGIGSDATCLKTVKEVSLDDPKDYNRDLASILLKQLKGKPQQTDRKRKASPQRERARHRKLVDNKRAALADAERDMYLAVQKIFVRMRRELLR